MVLHQKSNTTQNIFITHCIILYPAELFVSRKMNFQNSSIIFFLFVCAGKFLLTWFHTSWVLTVIIGKRQDKPLILIYIAYCTLHKIRYQIKETKTLAFLWKQSWFTLLKTLKKKSYISWDIFPWTSNFLFL